MVKKKNPDILVIKTEEETTYKTEVFWYCQLKYRKTTMSFIDTTKNVNFCIDRQKPRKLEARPSISNEEHYFMIEVLK